LFRGFQESSAHFKVRAKAGESLGVTPCIFRRPYGKPPNRADQDKTGVRVVEEHLESGEVLLDRGSGHLLAELLDVGGADHRLELLEGKAASLAPGEKPAHGDAERGADVLVADLGGKKLDKPPLRQFSGPGDDQKPAKDGIDAHEAVSSTVRAVFRAPCSGALAFPFAARRRLRGHGLEPGRGGDRRPRIRPASAGRWYSFRIP